MTVIDRFQGDLRFLSNFYAGHHPVTHRGIPWPTAEHAYQAAKSFNAPHVNRIWACESPGDAKRAGRSVALPPHWGTSRVLVMWGVLCAKFEDPHLLERLRETGGAVLVEGNTWHDQFWGSCTCVQRACQPPGENWLGRLLMVLRDDPLPLTMW